MQFMTNPFSGERLATTVMLDAQAAQSLALARSLLGSRCAATRAAAAVLEARCLRVLRRAS